MKKRIGAAALALASISAMFSAGSAGAATPTLDQQIQADHPRAYWRLTTSYADLSGHAHPMRAEARHPALSSSGVTITPNRYLYSDGSWRGASLHAELVFSEPATSQPGGRYAQLLELNGPGNSAFDVDVTGGGLQVVVGGSGPAPVFGSGLADGRAHIVTVETGRTSTRIFLDGALAFSGRGAAGRWNLNYASIGSNLMYAMRSARVSYVNVGPRISDARALAHQVAALAQLRP